MTPRGVLLTGFDAFGGADRNPSELAARALHGRTIAGHRVRAVVLPTAFAAAPAALAAALARPGPPPALVLCVGQAGGRAAIGLERVAINLADAPIPDNAGHRPQDAPLRPDGPAAHLCRLPLKAMRAALDRAGLPAELSLSAGSFVCNAVFYELLHRLATDPRLRATRGGFIHVPWLPGQGEPSLPLDALVRGLRVAVAAALGPAGEPAEGGALH
jgi:pyroglutamyl-peptidase